MSVYRGRGREGYPSEGGGHLSVLYRDVILSLSDSYFSSPPQALANFWLEKNHNLLNIIIYCPTSILSSKFHTDLTSIGGDNKICYFKPPTAGSKSVANRFKHSNS